MKEDILILKHGSIQVTHINRYKSQTFAFKLVKLVKNHIIYTFAYLFKLMTPAERFLLKIK